MANQGQGDPHESWTRVAVKVRDLAQSESDQGRRTLALRMADIFEQEGRSVESPPEPPVEPEGEPK